MRFFESRSNPSPFPLCYPVDSSAEGSIPVEKYLALKEALTLSDTRVQQLLLSNRDLKQEIALLQNMVRKLMHENLSLRKMKGMDVTSYTGRVNGTVKPMWGAV